MKRLLTIAAALAALGLSACADDYDSRDANAICKPYGGVLSSDYHSRTIVCADKIARDTISVPGA